MRATQSWIEGSCSRFLVVPALAALALAPAADQLLDHAKVGNDFLAERGLDPSTDGLDDLFQKGFVRFELGAFLLLTPTETLADPAAADRFQIAAAALLKVHESWIDTVDPGGERVARKEVASDAKAVGKWIAAWKDKDLVAVTAGQDLGTAMPAKDKELAALARLNGALLAAGLPAEDGAPPARAQLILVPDRRTFVSLCSAVGCLREDQRANYWVESMPNWVEFRFDETRVVALEYADNDPGTWEGGLPMDGRNEQGIEEQLAQLACGSLVLSRFGNRIDPDFSLALCNNLVIDAFGKVDTRTDGDLRPRTAAARKMFVPGGLSQGGVLPQNDASSPWRATRGADRFVGVLFAAQESGAKEAGERKAVDCFLLTSDDTTQRFVARPPFFGPAAASTQVPGEAFQGEWLELQRAYRVAFCYWLREEGAGKEKVSNAAFAELMIKLAPDGDVDFAAAIEAAYGMPVSSAEPGEGDLEGRFLAWLAKQR
jgi:hypothetical protein